MIPLPDLLAPIVAAFGESGVQTQSNLIPWAVCFRGDCSVTWEVGGACGGLNTYSEVSLNEQLGHLEF